MDGWLGPFLLPGLLVSIALGIWATSGNARRVLSGRKPTVVFDEGEPKKNRRPILLLIHGTYARNARWTSTQHPFVRRLLEAIPGARIAHLDWSGDNSHTVRHEAARVIASWLDQLPRTVPVYLIGHSHGGTIGAMACALSTNRNVRLVTMATPFLRAKARDFGITREQGEEGLSADKTRYIVLLIHAVALAAYGLNSVLDLLDIAVEERLRVFTLAFVGYIVLAFRSGDDHKKFRRRIASLCGPALRQAVLQERVAIFRVDGDEATAGLGVTQLCSRISRSLLELANWLLERVRLLEQTARAMFIQALGERYWWVAPWGMFVTIALFPPSRIKWTLGACVVLLLLLSAFTISRIAEAALNLVSLPFFGLLNLPFGIEFAWNAGLVTVSAEWTPMGSWRTKLIEARRRTLLAHSDLYDLPDVPAFIGEWHSGRSLEELMSR